MQVPGKASLAGPPATNAPSAAPFREGRVLLVIGVLELLWLSGLGYVLSLAL